jgi:hypothetical protein
MSIRARVEDAQLHAFERFLEAAHSVSALRQEDYRGECHPIEHILYKWFRCELVHEGSLPIDVESMPDDGPGALSVRALAAHQVSFSKCPKAGSITCSALSAPRQSARARFVCEHTRSNNTGVQRGGRPPIFRGAPLQRRAPADACSGRTRIETCSWKSDT